MISSNIEEDINMLKKERLVKIAHKVNQNGIITIQEIMDELGVSDMAFTLLFTSSKALMKMIGISFKFSSSFMSLQTSNPSRFGILISKSIRCGGLIFDEFIANSGSVEARTR